MLQNAGFLNDRTYEWFRALFSFPNTEDKFRNCQHSVIIRNLTGTVAWIKSPERCVVLHTGQDGMEQAVVNSFGLKCIRYSYTSCCQNALAGIKNAWKYRCLKKLEDYWKIWRSSAPTVRFLKYGSWSEISIRRNLSYFPILQRIFSQSFFFIRRLLLIIKSGRPMIRKQVTFWE